jgi:hypothetical protein
MTDKSFIIALLNGACIMKRPCHRKGYNHALYRGRAPIANISHTMMRKYAHLFKEHRQIITFNLNLVRQEHGNTLVKILYKQKRKSIQNDNA